VEGDPSDGGWRGDAEAELGKGRAKKTDRSHEAHNVVRIRVKRA